MKNGINNTVQQPMAEPAFLCLPDLVSGIPIFLEIRDLAAEIPSNLFHENPPLFIASTPLKFMLRSFYFDL